jgi:iron complex transport system permease protein
MRPAPLLSALTLLALLSAVFSLATGSMEIGWGELWSILRNVEAGTGYEVVWELRLPRAASAFATGGLLALAGALMQVLLRNPLADPYILGISGGAAGGALMVLLLGLGAMWLHLAAFAGALLTMALVFGLSRGRGSWTPTRLLLTGVVIATGWSAVIGFMLALSPDQTLRGMVFWLMGDLSYGTRPGTAFIVLAGGLLAALALSRSLNVLVRGERPAAALGVAVRPTRSALYLLASMLSATAVTLSGSIGFIGLVTPHMLRLSGTRDHRILLPAAVLLGGSLLMIADTLARTLLAPRQLPVGILTALTGVPVFLYLLYRGDIPRAD